MWWIIVSVVVAAIHLLRQYVTHKSLEQLYVEEFEGGIYTYGEAVIAKRPASKADGKSIVCFPGFMEDMRYFTDLYQNCEDELIFINNASYHSPFSLDKAQAVDWGKNPYAAGLIRHDAFVMSEVLKNLVSHNEVVIHGHSRGAAVTLETGKIVPELTCNISALLEAPVLPRGKVFLHVPKLFKYIGAYFFPLGLAYMRRVSASYLNKLSMNRSAKKRKTQLLLSAFYTTKRYKTLIVNVNNLFSWADGNTYDVYSAYKKVVVVVGERDHVLQSRAIMDSASKGAGIGAKVEVVQTQKTTHFISLEQPESIRALVKAI